MIKIAICDDEEQQRKIVTEYCHRYCEERHIEYRCEEYASGEELLLDAQADIMLLDIEMTGLDGLQVKDILQRQKSDIRILFVSRHEDVISEAFGRQVYGFLRKPVDYGLLQKKMDVILEDLEEQGRYILCDISGEIRKVSVNRLRYIQADGKYTKLFLEGEKEYIFSGKSIGMWKKELETDGFGMCHRSYLVNFYYVNGAGGEITLKGEGSVPISRRMEKEFHEAYKKYLWRKARAI